MKYLFWAAPIFFLACAQNQSTDRSNPESIDLIGDPYAELHEVNSESDELVLGIVTTTQYQSGIELVRTFDSNQDNILDPEESSLALATIREQRESILAEKTDEIRAAADADADGVISEEEVKALLRAKKLEMQESIKEANTQLRAANTAMVAVIQEHCQAETKGKGNGKGKSGGKAVELNDQQIDESLAECKAAKDGAKEEFFSAISEKREVIKDIISQFQAIHQSLKEFLGESDEDETDENLESNGPQKK